ncbi:unnamed protein product [Protopolystoma xenopodis]|uniref:Nucleolar protein 6 n=1 Tax=Protopolystoma xenopodis TaxID=117903 RepID=A0A448XI49_9PLAT|nr:unnamed protein product [Protopolystoma xenopodis]
MLIPYFSPDGLIFRLSIAERRELHLLQQLPFLRDSFSESNVTNQSSSGVCDDGWTTVGSGGAVPAAMNRKEKRGTGLLSAFNRVPRIDTPLSLAWARMHLHLPQVASLLMAISRSHPFAYPQACRLAKRWLAAHGFPVITCPELASEEACLLSQDPGCSVSSKLSGAGQYFLLARKQGSRMAGVLGYGANRMTEIALELLVARAGGFIGGVVDGLSTDRQGSAHLLANQKAMSPFAVFLRFLNLLANFNWETKPLLINLNDGFSGTNLLYFTHYLFLSVDKTIRHQALTSFHEALRGDLPAMVLATPIDPRGVQWTIQGPSRLGLSNLKHLACRSHSLLRAMAVAGADIFLMKASGCFPLEFLISAPFKNLHSVR